MRSLNLSAVIFHWGSSSGTVLDPSNVVSAFQIGQNVRASFAAFEDEDRDGVEDYRG